MRRILPILAVSSTLPMLLAACAVDKDAYPSLARRPIERLATDSPPPAPAPAFTPPSPETLARIEALAGQAHHADRRFRTTEGRTRELVAAAAGAAVASESWSVATVALAELESARSEAMIALADLDALYAAGLTGGAEISAARTARSEVIALVDGQDRVLAELRGRLAS